MRTFGFAVSILIATLWFLGWYAKRWVASDADYLLAGRKDLSPLRLSFIDGDISAQRPCPFRLFP